MAEDRGGLHYTINIDGNFAKAIELFQSKLAQGAKAFQDFKRNVGDISGAAANGRKALDAIGNGVSRISTAAPKARAALSAAANGVKQFASSVQVAGTRSVAFADVVERLRRRLENFRPAAKDSIDALASKSTVLARLRSELSAAIVAEERSGRASKGTAKQNVLAAGELLNVIAQRQRFANTLVAEASKVEANRLQHARLAGTIRQTIPPFDAAAIAAKKFELSQQQAAVKAEVLRLELARLGVTATSVGTRVAAADQGRLLFERRKQRTAVEREVATLQVADLKTQRSAIQAQLAINRFADPTKVRVLGEQLHTVDARLITIGRRFPDLIVGINGLKDNLQSSSRTAEVLIRNFKTLFTTLVAFQAIRLFTGLFKQAVTDAVQFNAEIEDVANGIKGTILSLGQVRDATGRTVEGAERFALAQGEANRQVSLLRQETERTSVTFQDLAKTFQEAVGPGLAVGLNLDQVRELSILFSNAADDIGLAQEQVADSIRAISSETGRATPLLRSLGITREQLADARAAGTLFEFLSAKLAAFKDQGQGIGQTLADSFVRLKSTIQGVLGAAGLSLFQDVKRVVLDVRNALTVKTGDTFLPRPEVVAIVAAGLSGVRAALQTIRELFSSISLDALLRSVQGVGDIIRLVTDLSAVLVRGLVQGFSVITASVGQVASVLTSLSTGFRQLTGLNLGSVTSSLLAIAIVLKTILVTQALWTKAIDFTKSAANSLNLALNAIGVRALFTITSITRVITLFARGLALVSGVIAGITAVLAIIDLVTGRSEKALAASKDLTEDVNALTADQQALITANTEALEKQAEIQERLAENVEKANQELSLAQATKGLEGFARDVKEALTAAGQKVAQINKDNAEQAKRTADAIEDVQKRITELSGTEDAKRVLDLGKKLHQESFAELSVQTDLARVHGQIVSAQKEQLRLAEEEARLPQTGATAEELTRAAELQAARIRISLVINVLREREAAINLELDSRQQKLSAIRSQYFQLQSSVKDLVLTEGNLLDLQDEQKKNLNEQEEKRDKIQAELQAQIATLAVREQERLDKSIASLAIETKIAALARRRVGGSESEREVALAEAELIQIQAQVEEKIRLNEQQRKLTDESIRSLENSGLENEALEVRRKLDEERLRIIESIEHQLENQLIKIESLRRNLAEPVESPFANAIREIGESLDRTLTQSQQGVSETSRVLREQFEELRASVAIAVDTSGLTGSVREMVQAISEGRQELEALRDRLSESETKATDDLALIREKLSRDRQELQAVFDRIFGKGLLKRAGERILENEVKSAVEAARAHADRLQILKEIATLEARGEGTDQEAVERIRELRSEAEELLKGERDREAVVSASLRRLALSVDEEKRLLDLVKEVAASQIKNAEATKDAQRAAEELTKAERTQDSLTRRLLTVREVAAREQFSLQRQELRQRLVLARLERQAENRVGASRELAEAQLEVAQIQFSFSQQEEALQRNILGIQKELTALGEPLTFDQEVRLGLLQKEGERQKELLDLTKQIRLEEEKRLEKRLTLAQGKKDDPLVGGLKAAVADVEEQVGEIGDIVERVGVGAIESFAQQGAEAISSVFDPESYEPLGQRLRRFVQGIVQALIQEFLRLAAVRAAVGLGLAAAAGGEVTEGGGLQRQRGGPVPRKRERPSWAHAGAPALSIGSAIASAIRPPNSKDIIPAWLQPGEWVIRKAAVRRFGSDFFAALNSMRLEPSILRGVMATKRPHFEMTRSSPPLSGMAGGGVVPSSSGTISGAGPPTLMIVNKIGDDAFQSSLVRPKTRRVVENIITAGVSVRRIRAA